MFGIIPFILIVISIVTIIVVVVRKFPQLTLLDVENIPEVVMEKKKDKILKKRIDKKTVEQRKVLKSWFVPIVRVSKQLQLKFRKYVGKVERGVSKNTLERVQNKKKIIRKESGSGINQLLEQAKSNSDHGDLEGAEKKYIAVIRLEPKQKQAYRGLADVYMRQNQYEQARETYEFILQLDSKDDAVLIKLAELYELTGDNAEAIEYYQKAVLLNPNLSNRFAKLADLLNQIGQYSTALEAIEQAVDLEPENPKYLDMLTEISIMVGDQELALEAYSRLRMANPENQKLEAFKNRIDKMA